MDTNTKIFLFLSAAFTLAAAWSIPYPVQRAPLRVTRYAPRPPQFRHPEVHPVRRDPNEEQWPRPKRDHHDNGDHDHDDHSHGHSDPHGHKDTHGVTGPVHTFEQWPRPKRDHHDYGDHDHDDHHSDHHGHKDTRGVTGPVHTFVKTDKNANYKWGVRHHVGNKYAN